MTDRASALLGSYSGALNRLAPMVRLLADTTHTGDVDALAQLLDRASQLSHMASRLPTVFRPNPHHLTKDGAR